MIDLFDKTTTQTQQNNNIQQLDIYNIFSTNQNVVNITKQPETVNKEFNYDLVYNNVDALKPVEKDPFCFVDELLKKK